MCNEKIEKDGTYDYRFFDYRLDQLESQIRKGMEKLEQEQNDNYKEILQMLQLLQENNNEQNRTLIELTQRQQNAEQKIKCIDKLREVATKNTTEIREIERRLDIYKQLLFVTGTGVVIALLSEIITLV